MERDGCTVVVAKQYWNPSMGRIPVKRTGLTKEERYALKMAHQGRKVWFEGPALHIERKGA